MATVHIVEKAGFDGEHFVAQVRRTLPSPCHKCGT
jgi:hypothetical protein